MAEKELYPINCKFVYNVKDGKVYPTTNIFIVGQELIKDETNVEREV